MNKLPKTEDDRTPKQREEFRRKTSTELLTDAGLNDFLLMLLDLDMFNETFSALEADYSLWQSSYSAFASAETQRGIASLRAAVKEQEDSYDNELNALDEEIRALERTIANTTEAANLERAKVEEEYQTAVRLVEEETAQKKLAAKAEYEATCLSAKAEYEAKCRQYYDELASHVAASNPPQ